MPFAEVDEGRRQIDSLRPCLIDDGLRDLGRDIGGCRAERDNPYGPIVLALDQISQQRLAIRKTFVCLNEGATEGSEVLNHDIGHICFLIGHADSLVAPMVKIIS